MIESNISDATFCLDMFGYGWISLINTLKKG